MKAILSKTFFILFATLFPLAVFGQETTAEEGHRAQQRVVLEQIHAREMARLTAIKKVAEQRESEEMVKEVDSLIAQAKARHENALKILDEPKEEEADSTGGA